MLDTLGSAQAGSKVVAALASRSTIRLESSSTRQTDRGEHTTSTCADGWLASGNIIITLVNDMRRADTQVD